MKYCPLVKLFHDAHFNQYFYFLFFSNSFTDSSDCFPCDLEYWSNERKDRCVLKVVEFLSYTEIMGMVLCIFSLLGCY